MMRAFEIRDSSQVAVARRAAADVAGSLGADEAGIGRASLVASELATNLLKHGGGGELLVCPYEDDTGAGTEIIALDRGAGIANIDDCLRDGYSSAGSSGHGLGAVRRQAAQFAVASWPGEGTAILARIRLTARAPASAGIVRAYGAVTVPKPGESVCGDACCVVETAVGRTLLVVDGLGHGPQAATAAAEAQRLFLRNKDAPVHEILALMHAGLRPTRGAAIAVARFDLARSVVRYGGIGNIAGAIVNGVETRRMISLNGTAGHVARRIQTFDYAYRDGLVIMHSDGLVTGWSLDRYPGITRMDPTLVAAVMYRDFTRGRDDASVLVARGAIP
jgi:anti-sigma regulatory factor (Ser/Thr protein kinase)